MSNKGHLDQPVDKSLIIRYFGGWCTPEETARVEKWLEQESNERRMQEWLWEDWEEQQQEKMPEDMAARLKAGVQEAAGVRRQRPLRRLYARIAAAAAVAAFVISAAFLFRNGNAAGDTFVAVYKDSISNTTAMPRKISLPDGSGVWLNSGAVLYVADNFGEKERRVKIKGEAFFDIARDMEHPFYTEAAGVTTRVLGTSYNVEAYPGEEDVRVSLLSGKVSIAAADTAFTLSPGQMAVYTAGKRRFAQETFAAVDPSAWIKGKIVLNRVPLPAVLNRLGRIYNVSIQFDPYQLADKYIEGEFGRNEFPEVLTSVLFVHQLRFSVTKEGQYIIH